MANSSLRSTGAISKTCTVVAQSTYCCAEECIKESIKDPRMMPMFLPTSFLLIPRAIKVQIRRLKLLGPNAQSTPEPLRQPSCHLALT